MILLSQEAGDPASCLCKTDYIKNILSFSFFFRGRKKENVSNYQFGMQCP